MSPRDERVREIISILINKSVPPVLAPRYAKEILAAPNLDEALLGIVRCYERPENPTKKWRQETREGAIRSLIRNAVSQDVAPQAANEIVQRRERGESLCSNWSTNYLR